MSPFFLVSSATSWPCSRRHRHNARPMNPAAPVTRMLAIDEAGFHRLEFFNCLDVVVRPADIQPIAVVAAYGNFASGGDKVEHQVVEAIGLSLGNVLHRSAADHIDTHAHFVLCFGLFAKA